MLPEEQAHFANTLSLVQNCLSESESKRSFRGIRPAISKLHEDLLPNDLKVRLKRATNKGDFPELLQAVQRHLQHYHDSFQRIWRGERRTRPIPQEFQHQRALLNSARRRRMDAAQFLHNTFWTDHETEDGQQKNWHHQNSIKVPDLLYGMNELRVAGLVSKNQADAFSQRILDISSGHPATRRAKGDRRIDPNTVRSALIYAWGASGMESDAMRSWDARALDRILQLPTR